MRRTARLAIAAAAATASAASAQPALAATLVEGWTGATDFPADRVPAGIAADAAGVRVALSAWPGGLLRAAYTGEIDVRGAGYGGWLGGTPTGVATAAGGATYVTQPGTSTLVRVPAGGGTAKQVGTPTAGAAPTAATSGPDGALYASLPGADRVARWDGLGRVEEVALPAGSAPRGVAVGGDGKLYVAVAGGIAVVDFAAIGATVTVHDAPGASRPTDLTTAPDGVVWFTDDGTNKVGRIRPDGSIQVRSLNGVRADGDLRAIAAHPDGSLWVGLHSAPGAIAHVRAEGDGMSVDEVVEVAPAEVGIVDLAVGADENVWYAGEGAPGHVGRVVLPARPTALRARNVTPASAVVDAAVHPRGRATTWWVQYADGRRTAPGTVPAGAAGVPVSVALTDLVPSSTTTARLVVDNGVGAPVAGPPLSISTPAAAPHSTGGDALLPPALGKRVVVAPAKGTVMVKLPGRRTPVALRATDDVPFGSVLDTRRGTVRLRSAVDAKGTVQSADFWGGVFAVQQGGAVTELHLRGPVPTCSPSGARAAAARKRVVRRLWGKDKGGRFRTHGRDSVATVRGTRWLVEESCRSTTTRVVEGAVAVKDRGTGRTVLVKAGGRYVAKRVTKRP